MTQEMLSHLWSLVFTLALMTGTMGGNDKSYQSYQHLPPENLGFNKTEGSEENVGGGKGQFQQVSTEKVIMFLYHEPNLSESMAATKYSGYAPK